MRWAVFSFPIGTVKAAGEEYLRFWHVQEKAGAVEVLDCIA